MTTNFLAHPTHLFIADPQSCTEHITALLQNLFCSHTSDEKACNACITCKQIANKEHPFIYWFTPERSYSVDDIDTILEQSKFTLDENEYRFFIIQQAECLTDASANRLLKTIEEPAPRYYYFLTTNQKEVIAPTIVSRCLQHALASTDLIATHKEIIEPFITLEFNDPIGFIKQLDAHGIKEQETKYATEYLFAYYAQEYKKVVQNNNEAKLPTISKLLMICDQALDAQPMTGGAKLFWKNLYLQCHHAKRN